MSENKKYKVPVILYESEDNPLPYIEVQEGDEMPPSLFIQEYKHTGEYEPDGDGNEQPIIDMLVHMYIDMDFLKKKLSPELYDEVRVSMGLQPVQKAREEGQKILDRVYDNVNKKVEEAQKQKQETKEELAKEFNERLAEKFYKKDEQQDDESGEDSTQYPTLEEVQKADKVYFEIEDNKDDNDNNDNEGEDE